MVTVREANWHDYEAIVSLNQRYGLWSKPMPYEDWQKMWLANPLVLEKGMLWPFGWVLENESGVIVGYLGNIPMGYELAGRPVIAVAANSWVVESECRSKSLLLLSKFFSQPAVDLFLNTTADYAAGAVFAGFRCKKVPTPDYDQVLLAITGYRGFGQAFFRKHQLPLPQFLGGVTGFCIWLADLLTGRLKRLNPPRQLRLSTAVNFDGRFDNFWQQLKEQRQKLLFIRGQKNLEWHYQVRLSTNRGWISICEKNAEMVGYAIYIHDDNDDIGLKRAKLADLQALGDQRESVMLSLISHGLEICKVRKIYVLEIIGYEEEKRQIIKKLVTRQRKLPTWPYFYKTKEKSLAAILENKDYWDPSIIDGDASF